MKTFTASRIADGQGMFPCKIIVGANKITVRIPGLFHNKDKEIPFNKISEVSVDTPLVGYSTITFYTTGVGVVHAHGFKKAQVKEIKELIEVNDEDTEITPKNGRKKTVDIESDEDETSEVEEVVLRPKVQERSIADELDDEYKEWSKNVQSRANAIEFVEKRLASIKPNESMAFKQSVLGILKSLDSQYSGIEISPRTMVIAIDTIRQTKSIDYAYQLIKQRCSV